MKNTIYKSYLKKMLRSEAFVSVIIVFVLAIGIIGTSYAVYMDVDTDNEYQLVKSGDLSISYQDGDSVIHMDDALPLEDNDVILGNQDPVYYTFSVMNTGSYDVIYDISLQEMVDNTVDLDYVNYIFCKETCEGKDTNDINRLSEKYILHTDRIKSGIGTADTYIIKLWLNSEYKGDIERSLNLQVVVSARNDGVKNLADTIMSDSRIKKNQGTPSFTDVEINEVGMYSADDDYGKSWYFRGAQSHNYVNFAGFTWRVVRINGDGSIRLILDGTLDKVKNPLTSSGYSGVRVEFDTNNFYDNAYVGYMYGDFTGNSTTYDQAHKNQVSSSVKQKVDLFYETFIENTTLHYEKYLADTLFCGDKTLALEFYPDNYGFGTTAAYYAMGDRLNSPTFKCAVGETKNYSRYTSKLDTSETLSNGVSVNNDLIHPIALLSADEMIFAGATSDDVNTSYYLSDSYYYTTSIAYQMWWTMTPDYYHSTKGTIVYAGVSPDNAGHNSLSSSYSLDHRYGVRPVINLKSDVIVSGGNGTIDSPYTVTIY